MKKLPIPALGMLAGLVLVTGCPHNEYLVELTPRGNTMERRLTFYRTDGEPSGGSAGTEVFPTNEMARIARCYPPASVKRDGDHYVVAREFAGAMPDDIGGAGSYTNLSTPLGSAGFYVERFRGNDDPAGVAAIRLRAADQLADLALAWARDEFGREPHFDDLRRFLDVNFRHDLRNLSAYFAPVFDGYAGPRPAASEEEARKSSELTFEEFAVRFGQYLIERGYLKTGDIPGVLHMFVVSDEKYLTRLLQRLLAGKLQVPESGALPPSLARLADPDTLARSWNDSVAKTDLYKSKVAEAATGGKPKGSSDKPDPADLTGDLFFTVVGLRFDSFGRTDDHLTVRLALPSPPVRTNGRWDETRRQVLWDANLDSGTNTARFPAICYAGWSRPNEPVQTAHFGQVLLTGDNLLQYCLWFAGLDEKSAAEWSALLTGLQPGGWQDKLEAFRFSGEPRTAADSASPLASDFPRSLFRAALAGTPSGGEK